MADWKEVQRSLRAWENKLTERKGARDQLLKSRKAEEATLTTLQQEQQTAKDASVFLLNEVAERRAAAVKGIENTSTSGLQMVYDEGYRLYFESFEEDRKEGASNFQMELQVTSSYEGEELVTGLVGERGGGLLENVDSALRWGTLEYIGYDGPILLDEAFKSMSNDDKINAVANQYRELHEHTGRQIIFATHKGAFHQVADRIIKIEKEDGIAVAKVMSANYVPPEDGLADVDGGW